MDAQDSDSGSDSEDYKQLHVKSKSKSAQKWGKAHVTKNASASPHDSDPKGGRDWTAAKQLKRLRAEEKLCKGELKKRSKSEGKKMEEPAGDEDQVRGNKGRSYTVSIAVAGSIIDNAQSPALKAYLAGQVSRAAAIFLVDEVIVYDDTGGSGAQGCEQMARVLQYLECPQYLRKELFPLHPDLQYAGLIAPLDIPHHLRKNEAMPYREGVVSSKPTKDGKEYALVNVGLDRDCRIDKKLRQGVRVTVKFDNPSPAYILKPKGKLKGTVVSPHEPQRESGIYWGYTVRLATNLGKVFSECPFKGGYDVKVGTSEKGEDCRLLQPTTFQHLLIVFGGVEGLEYALENDETLSEDNVSALFDHYVNTCPAQGSRTIRTEEAILISMQALSQFIEKGE